MTTLARVTLPLLDEWEHERGSLTIAALPSHKYERTIVCARDLDDESESVQLVEGKEYVYSLDVSGQTDTFDNDHTEMFVPDNERGDRGRLRTGQYTGTVEVRFFAAHQFVGKARFEVQSTKLSYRTDYQWMLRDIADVCAELVMERFGPSEARFSADEGRGTEVLYQRFAFLCSALEGDEFRAAIGHILASPQVTWAEIEETTTHARGIRPSSRVARSLTRPGPRVQAMNTFGDDLESVPQRMILLRSTTSVDNVPNRFIKWLLHEWVVIISRVSSAFAHNGENAAFAHRGKRQIARMRHILEGILDDDLFRNVRELEFFPEANQVLQKREGYRYLFRLHLQMDAAARLYWPGLDPVYRAGQRNVAKLYEYWVYLQLGRIIARICGKSFDARRLIESAPDGLTLRLHSREETMVEGNIERFGQIIRIESWFNKSFGASIPHGDGSWSRPLRPDCSIRIAVTTQEQKPFVTWIHFDAKYRIERLEETMDADDEDNDLGRSRFRREDLLKMHAYKDAIRHSAGAYVVFPGTEDTARFRQYHELLPGLGAFPLRPSEIGESRGSNALAIFIEQVISHLAMQATQYARVRYWTDRAVREASVTNVSPAAPFLQQPPADVNVLLGFAKNTAHRDWIRHRCMYNLRADAHRGGAVGVTGKELDAGILIVFGDDQHEVDIYEIIDVPRILTSGQLQSMHYPDPRGNHYLCLGLKRLSNDSTANWLDRDLIVRVRSQKNPEALFGAPMVVTWLELCAMVAATSLTNASD